MSQGKRYLSSDKALENVSNHAKHHHLDDSLNILAKHLIHHVRVGHHVHRVGGFNFFVEIAVVIIAVESLTSFDGLFR